MKKENLYEMCLAEYIGTATLVILDYSASKS